MVPFFVIFRTMERREGTSFPGPKRRKGTRMFPSLVTALDGPYVIFLHSDILHEVLGSVVLRLYCYTSFIKNCL